MVCTFFEAFNVPVFWPILVMYFIMLFCITMKRQIKVNPGTASGPRPVALGGVWAQACDVEGDAGPAAYAQAVAGSSVQARDGHMVSRLPPPRPASTAVPYPRVQELALGRQLWGLCPCPRHGVLWVSQDLLDEDRVMPTPL